VANLTKSELADRVLEYLGVKPAGQAASVQDSSRVQELVDSAHSRLRAEGLAPFAVSAIPEWAQVPLRDFVAVDAAPMFGKLQNPQAQMAARHELSVQLSSPAPAVPTRPYFY